MAGNLATVQLGDGSIGVEGVAKVGTSNNDLPAEVDVVVGTVILGTVGTNGDGVAVLVHAGTRGDEGDQIAIGKTLNGLVSENGEVLAVLGEAFVTHAL